MSVLTNVARSVNVLRADTFEHPLPVLVAGAGLGEADLAHTVQVEAVAAEVAEAVLQPRPRPRLSRDRPPELT